MTHKQRREHKLGNVMRFIRNNRAGRFVAKGVLLVDNVAGFGIKRRLLRWTRRCEQGRNDA